MSRSFDLLLHSRWSIVTLALMLTTIAAPRAAATDHHTIQVSTSISSSTNAVAIGDSFAVTISGTVESQINPRNEDEVSDGSWNYSVSFKYRAKSTNTWGDPPSGSYSVDWHGDQSNGTGSSTPDVTLNAAGYWEIYGTASVSFQAPPNTSNPDDVWSGSDKSSPTDIMAISATTASGVPSPITTFTNTKNEIEVTVVPAAGASYVHLQTEDSTIMTFSGQSQDYALSTSPEDVDVLGVPSNSGTTYIDWYVQSGNVPNITNTENTTTKTSSTGNDGQFQQKETGTVAQAAQASTKKKLLKFVSATWSSSIKPWHDFATNPQQTFGDTLSSEANTYLQNLANEMIQSGDPSEMQAGFNLQDYLQNEGGTATLHQDSSTLVTLALDTIKDSYDNVSDSTFNNVDLTNDGYTPVVPAGTHFDHNVSLAATIKTITPEDIIQHSNDLADYIKPNTVIKSFNINASWWPTTLDEVTAKFSVPLSDVYPNASTTQPITGRLDLKLFNWKHAEFDSYIKGTYTPPNGELGGAVGIQVTIH